MMEDEAPVKYLSRCGEIVDLIIDPARNNLLTEKMWLGKSPPYIDGDGNIY
jgi:hypothetical protein